MGKDEKTEIVIKSSILVFSFDVERSMFDVGRSSFKTTLNSEPLPFPKRR
jgi:hypothetical protein